MTSNCLCLKMRCVLQFHTKNFRDFVPEVFDDQTNQRFNQLVPSPLGAIFTVFDGHAHLFELVADLV